MPIGMRDGLVAEREFFPQPTLKSYKSQEKQEVKIAKIQGLYFLFLSDKGQLISKANIKVFIWTKKQTKYFCISALASKSGQINEL